MTANSINDIPYYLQIKELIKNKIENGDYKLGEKLASENELAKFYGVNRQTVRTGIEGLVYEGYLKTVPGKGTYVVNTRHIEDIQDFDVYKTDVSEDNRQVIKKGIRKAGPFYSSIFNIAEEDLIYKYVILKTIDKEPFTLDYVFIKRSEIKKLYGFDLKVFTLDEIYKLYNIQINKVVQDLDITFSNKDISKYLDIDLKTAIIRIVTKKYIGDNEILEYKVSYTRPDKCSFINDFSVSDS